MAKRKNSRYTKRDGTIDPYKNLVSDVIIDAIQIALEQSAASDKRQAEAILFLQSAKCARWAGLLGLNWDEIISHPNSLTKLVIRGRINTVE